MIRPATPGTLLVLVAAILLGLVTISTPIIKSIYFLSATIGGTGNESGQTATFGALGYCIGSQCSNTTLGYSFDPNQLLGINVISGSYTTPVIKGLTYTLILHPIALAFAALAVLLGLISHCRELSTNCFGTFVTSVGAFITLVAFGLDLALFIIAKKRIDSINGASAQLGMAIWMTLAAWILMFLAGCAFSCGICSRRKRNRVKDSDIDKGGYGARPAGPYPQRDNYAEQMRMDALDAEADRKRRQATRERSGRDELPKFAEYEEEYAVPLTKDYEDGAYSNHNNSQPGMAYSTNHNNAVGAGAGSAINGVGQGYGRRQAIQHPQPTDQFSNSPPMLNNSAGYGAHNSQAHRANTYSSVGGGAAAATAAAPGMPLPETAAAHPTYVPGVGPQPYRDGLDSQPPSSLNPAPRPYPMVTSPPPMTDLSHSTTQAQPQQYDSYGNVVPSATGGRGSGFAQSVAAAGVAGVGVGSRRQPTAEYGHPTEYSGATFGPGSGFMPQPQHQSSGGSQIRGSRALPSVPHEPQGIVYDHNDANTDNRRQGTVDDGFGITSSAPARHQTQDSGYDHYASSAYDHNNAAHNNDDYQSSVGPPGYESVAGGSGSQNTYRPYPHEKH